MKGAKQLASLPTGHRLRQWWGPEPLISNIQARQGRRTLTHRQALAMQSVSRFLGVVHHSGQWGPLPCGLSLPPGALPPKHTHKNHFLSAPTFSHFSNPTPLQSLGKARTQGTWKRLDQDKVLISREPVAHLVFLRQLRETLYLQLVQLVHLFPAGPRASLHWNRGAHCGRNMRGED